MLDDLLRAASLGLFLFGALAFSILTVSYWSERRNPRLERPPRSSAVFPLFTLVCAAAFSINLLFQIAPVAPGGWSTALLLLRDFAIGLLPPLMFGLVYEQEADWLRGCRAWRIGLAFFYAASGACALLRSLEGNGLVAVLGAVLLVRAPALGLLVAAAAGLGMQTGSRRIVASPNLLVSP